MSNYYEQLCSKLGFWDERTDKSGYEEFAERVLSQIALDYINASNIDRDNVKKLFFDACETWKQFFSEYKKGRNLVRTSLINSMVTNDYNMYEVCCNLISEERINNSQNMNIAISITENYIIYAYTMLVSLLENNKNRYINIYIMFNNIKEEKLLLFSDLEEKYRANIICQCIPDEWIPKELPTHNYWPKEIYFRCYLPAILPPDQDRVLYLDTDIIVNKTLDYLYDVPFMDMSIVACKDMSVKKTGLTQTQEELFSSIEDFSQDNYFNSGVVLFNLSKIRDNWTVPDIIGKAVELKEKMFAPDQDLLNYIFYNDVYYEDEEQYNAFARLKFNSGVDYSSIRQSATIIHFAGRKPWTGEAIRYNTERLWWEYASKLPKEVYLKLMEEFILSEIDAGYANEAIKNLM